MIAGFALFLAVAPLLLTLVNLRFLRAPELAVGHPGVSVLIPARNEEENIAAACAAVLASEGVELELIVLDDASTDRTPEILAGIGDARLRVAAAPALPPGWSGKQHACQALAGLATHELMVFVDADVRLAPDAVARMAGFMGRHEAGIASGFPRQVVVTWSEQLLLPLIHFLLLGFLPMAIMRRRLDPGLGAGCGQLFIVRRSAYIAAGGHAAIRASLHDGIMLPRAFRRAGHMSLLFDATGFATCRMYRNAAQVWEGLCKNATEGMAKPRALPFWTVILGGGQVLPLVLLVWSPGWAAGLALAAGIGTRLVLAWRFRQPVLSALVHPAGGGGVAGGAVVQLGAGGAGWPGHLARACLSGAMMVVAGSAAGATLEVVVTGVRNGEGDVRVAVCAQADFLKESCPYVAHVAARAGEVSLRLEVPPGVWAAQAFHDENRNGIIDRNLFGIPKEGLGFSNDAPFRFGPPSFADAAFQLAAPGGRIRLSLRYF